jgi:mono/diheme cytochrome c family protein
MGNGMAPEIGKGRAELGLAYSRACPACHTPEGSPHLASDHTNQQKQTSPPASVHTVRQHVTLGRARKPRYGIYAIDRLSKKERKKKDTGINKSGT